jgi:hypothetical protein
MLNFPSNLEPSDYATKFDYKSGIYLVVHNQSTLPFTLDSGINIPTGFETYISVNRDFTTKLDKPYSDCLKELKSDNTYAKKLFGYFNDLGVTYYDQNFCYTLCYQDKLINKCNCCDISTPSILNATYCANDDELECLEKFDTVFTVADLKNVCDSACPQQCNSVEYNLGVSMATYPSLSYLKSIQGTYLANEDGTPSSFFFPQDVDDANLLEFARIGFLKLILNYENLYYTSVDDSPKITSESLFGNLGGQLGLFIGLSILSFIEILELLIEFILIYIAHRKKQNVAPVTNFPYFNSGFVQQ